jgi:Ca2+-binding RTX toxin-like protein
LATELTATQVLTGINCLSFCLLSQAIALSSKSASLSHPKSHATEASETINGSASNEIINGLGGNDTLYGEDGNDSLKGGNGNDYLDGFTSKTGSDLDTLTGGAGIDTFVLGNSRQGVFYLGNGQATITDYSPSKD